MSNGMSIELVGFVEVIVEGRVIDDLDYPHCDEPSVLWCISDDNEMLGGVFLSVPPRQLHKVLAAYTAGLPQIKRGAVMPCDSLRVAVDVAAAMHERLLSEAQSRRS